jgi:hypothetical protein
MDYGLWIMNWLTPAIHRPSFIERENMDYELTDAVTHRPVIHNS